MSKFDLFLDRYKPKQPPERAPALLHGHLLFYLHTKGQGTCALSRSIVADFDHLPLDHKAIASKLSNLNRRVYKDFKINYRRDSKWAALETYAESPVTFDQSKSSIQPANLVSFTPPASPLPNPCQIPSSAPSTPYSARPISIPTRSSSRPQCDSCRNRERNREHLRQLAKRNSALRGTIQKLRPKYETNYRLGQTVVRKTYIEKHLRKRNTVLKKTVTKLEGELARERAKPTNSDLEEELKEKKTDLTNLSRALKRTKESLTELRKKVKQLEKDITSLNQENHNLICQLEEQEEEEENAVAEDEATPKPRQLSYKVRKNIYACLRGNVPIAKAPELINSILVNEHGVHPSQTPSKSTVGRCSSEVSVLNFLHATEVYLTQEVATLAWDACTFEQEHVNCIYVSHESKTMTLSCSPLAGSSTQDYVCHVTQTIDLMATIYAAYHEKDPMRIKDLIIKKVTSTVADRIRTNHCVTEALKTLWDADLQELNCNVHCLDGYAIASRKACKHLDAQMGISTSMGYDCAAAQVIAGLSYLRYLLFF